MKDAADIVTRFRLYGVLMTCCAIIGVTCSALVVSVLVPESVRQLVQGIPQIVVYLVPFAAYTMLRVMMDSHVFASSIRFLYKRRDMVAAYTGDNKAIKEEYKRTYDKIQAQLDKTFKEREEWYGQIAHLHLAAITVEFVFLSLAAVSYEWHGRLWLSVVLCLLVLAYVNRFYIQRGWLSIKYSVLSLFDGISFRP